MDNEEFLERLPFMIAEIMNDLMPFFGTKVRELMKVELTNGQFIDVILSVICSFSSTLLKGISEEMEIDFGPKVNRDYLVNLLYERLSSGQSVEVKMGPLH